MNSTNSWAEIDAEMVKLEKQYIPGSDSIKKLVKMLIAQLKEQERALDYHRSVGGHTGEI